MGPVGKMATRVSMPHFLQTPVSLNPARMYHD